MVADRPDIPASLRDLWNLCGPILRYRILRDVIGQDESYVETAHLRLDLLKHPDVQSVLNAQTANGGWGDFLTTEVTFLHLCELGLESCPAIEQARERVLERTLLKPDELWEFEKAGLNENGRKLARRIVRDKSLHMLGRSSRENDLAVRPFLEQILVEWDHYLTTHTPLPTSDGYAAVCLYPWSDDDFPRVSGIVKRLVALAEARDFPAPEVPDVLAPFLYRIADKWQYLIQPPRLFYELQLASKFGLAREMASTSWMLEELEARQDADGFFRFPDAGEIHPSWYFPIEKQNPEQFFIEYTVRAELIFKLLAYDV